MKVGLIAYGSLETVSGGYLYDRKLVAYLRSIGDSVEVISLSPGSYFSHLRDNLTFRLPSGVDILIEDELVYPSLLLANRQRSAALRGVPVVALVHNLHSSERRAAWQNVFFRQMEASYLRSVDGYIFNSRATRDSVFRLAGSSTPHIIAPPAGDRLGSVDPDQLRQRLAKSGPLRLLFLASVTPLKGLHVLLNALAGLTASSCALDVAGSLSVDPAYAARMQAQAASLPMRVTFHGILDNEPLVSLLKRTDVVVLPSFYEGFGIAYLEGMAFGVPAIGTTAGAIPQMITHGVNGYMIAPGDSAALADLLSDLAAHRSLLAHLSANALAHFLSCPTWAQSAETIRGFLLTMLGRG